MVPHWCFMSRDFACAPGFEAPERSSHGPSMMLFLLILILFSVCAPVFELAKPMPELPIEVQIARVLAVAAMFVALCWAAVRATR